MIALTLVLVAIYALYLYGTRNFKYWEQRNVKHDKPIPFFGTNFRNYFMQISTSDMAVEMYRKYPNEKIVGFYRANDPELVIRDPEIAKNILITDFPHFFKRGLNKNNLEIEPLLRNIFFVEGDNWRLLRHRMTPAFTSGKLKAMFPLIIERAERLQARALKAAAANKEMDARDLMARYTIDFIGACGFGLESDSLQEEDSAFRKLGFRMFDIGVKTIIIIVLKEIFPKLFAKLKVTSHFEKEIILIVNKVLQQRNYEPSGRNDFIDILLECKKKGLMTSESIEKFKPDGTPETVSMELDDELLAAQVFIFFAAGFETSSSATSRTLHELAYHPHVQEKVQEEIDRVLAKHNNKLSYEAVKEMQYLDWTFKEGMRIFPSLGYVLRECSRKYTFKELDVTIDEGVRVMIPIQALQMDPQYYDNPTEFRPERFDPNNLNPDNKYVYLPFGIGPRACIGERLGQMQSLAGLAAVLSRFSVRPAPSTRRQPIIDPASGIVQAVKGGLPLLFQERKPKVH